ncbi:MAG: glycosyltransferase [Chitinophagales bacterium]
MSWSLLLSLLFIVAATAQVLYYLLLFLRLALYKQGHYSNSADALPPVSIVICTRNNAEQLSRTLKLVLIQLYREFEVVVVNDGSSDHTMEVIAHYAARTGNLRVFTLPEQARHLGKKAALRLGVEQARYDIVVVTDDDCRPASTNWLSLLVAHLYHDTALVLGYSPITPRNSFLSLFQQYENVLTATQYFSYSLAGIPYMGVGRNMAFRRSLFLNWRQQPHTSDRIAGGDDDLFVNAVARGSSTINCIEKDSFVLTDAPPTLSAWLNQKRRHIRAGFYYRWWHQLLLFGFAFSKALFYFLIPVMTFHTPWQPFTWAALGTALFTMWFIQLRINNKLHQTLPGVLFPVFDMLYTLYLVVIFFLTSVRRNDTWKETNQQQK